MNAAARRRASDARRYRQRLKACEIIAPTVVSFDVIELPLATGWLDIFFNQLGLLRHYHYWLACDVNLHVLLGKFEPPGSPVFKYAMEQRASTQTPENSTRV